MSFSIHITLIQGEIPSYNYIISVSEPLSLATSLLRYAADDDRLLSFPLNVKAKIFSKEAGDNPTLWEAEVTYYVWNLISHD